MKREKREKNPKLSLFQKKNQHFAISKFSKFFKNDLYHKIEAQLEVGLGNFFQKKSKSRKRDRAKKPFKIATISNINILL